MGLFPVWSFPVFYHPAGNAHDDGTFGDVCRDDHIGSYHGSSTDIHTRKDGDLYTDKAVVTYETCRVIFTFADFCECIHLQWERERDIELFDQVSL